MRRTIIPVLAALGALTPAVAVATAGTASADSGTLFDLRDASAVASALSGVDAVCHQAAMVGLGVDLDDLPGYTGSNDLGTAVLPEGGIPRRMRAAYLSDDEVRELAAVAARRRSTARDAA